MRDQADELRQLVLRSVVRERIPEFPAPPLVVVSGGKGGVGSTTVAVNLTIALARQGQRAVLVDADFDQPDATSLCLSKATDSVADVLSGRRTVHEVLQRGPAGVQVLPGMWAPESRIACAPLAQQRMLSELGRLGAHADIVVLDVGSGLDETAARFWRAADLVLLVTTAEAASIMNSYATIKVLARDHQSSGQPAEVLTIVNMDEGHSDSPGVLERIGLACQRFLGLSVTAGPCIPLDRAASTAMNARRPVVLEAPQSSAAKALESLAELTLHTLRAGRHGPPVRCPAAA